jgi:hypothetical protein
MRKPSDSEELDKLQHVRAICLKPNALKIWKFHVRLRTALLLCQTRDSPLPGRIIARSLGTWLIRIYQGRDPETGKRRNINQTSRGDRPGCGSRAGRPHWAWAFAP